MRPAQWLLIETVMAMQEQLIATFGGLSGLRDQGLLESALARPQQLVTYGKHDLFDLAATYAFGLIRNHPFLDGNKRIGFAAAVVFLELNGQHFKATEADATIKTLALAAGELKEVEYAAWLRNNSTL
jgi:death-on-curing protein